ncbi:Calcium binding and coiled-coil domain (CALCOCO1) like [Mactra antiquata]
MATQDKEPIVIDEVVTFDEEDGDGKTPRADFATVVFHNIAESYPDDAHVECKYTVTSDLVPTSRDYVAIYKVGWMSPRDYYYYEWAPLPSNYKTGVDADASVLFPAHKLPKDDGEFYQFCYVSSANQIRGASTPFQFRHPSSDDFVEIEDEETNMLVIRSKTIFLQENLQMAQSQKQKLMESQEALQKERDTIITKYQEVKNRLTTMESENLSLKGRLTHSEATIEQLRREAHDMIVVRDELEKKIDKLKQDQVSINALTADLNNSLEKLQKVTDELDAKKAEVKKLQSEKDELSGKNATLKEEADLYKKHADSSEHFMNVAEGLHVKLASQESLVEQLKRNVDALTSELEENRQNLDQQTAVNIQDKDKIGSLEERLKNAEDKLMAAEDSKLLLQKEITAFEITQHEMSRQIEKSKTECESLKQKLCSLEEDFTQKTLIQKSEIEQTQTDLATVVEEKEKLQKDNSLLRGQMNLSLETHGSMSIMRLSLTQIKERLEKKEKKCKSLERAMRVREQEFLEHEREMRREIEDLKEKIYMCGEEYKAIFIEKSKLEKKIQKMTYRRKSKMSESEPGVEKESPRKSAPVESTPMTSTTSSIAGDIDKQIEELEAELDKKIVNKQKYKALYKDEKMKNETAKLKYDEELQQKDTEISRLKKRISELPNEYDLKMRALEKCVTEKELQIEELNQKLRMCNQGRNDETGASMSPRSTFQDGKYPYVMYPGHEASPNPGMPYGQWQPMYPAPGPIQYPYPPAQQQAPLVYPHHTSYSTMGPTQNQGPPPVPPRTHAPAKPKDSPQSKVDNNDLFVEADSTFNDVPEVDNWEISEQPLKPLPKPLEPEQLPTAKVAKIRSATGLSSLSDGDTENGLSSETELKVQLPKEPSAPTNIMDQTATERFYDAEGVAMKFCMECGQSFPVDVDENVFLEHQLSHMGQICPVCKVMKNDNMSDEDFAKHVNSHYDKESDNTVY